MNIWSLFVSLYVLYTKSPSLPKVPYRTIYGPIFFSFVKMIMLRNGTEFRVENGGVSRGTYLICYTYEEPPPPPQKKIYKKSSAFIEDTVIRIPWKVPAFLGSPLDESGLFILLKQFSEGIKSLFHRWNWQHCFLLLLFLLVFCFVLKPYHETSETDALYTVRKKNVSKRCPVVSL